jgi:hypothetical protein
VLAFQAGQQDPPEGTGVGVGVIRATGVGVAVAPEPGVGVGVAVGRGAGVGVAVGLPASQVPLFVHQLSTAGVNPGQLAAREHWGHSVYFDPWNFTDAPRP